MTVKTLCGELEVNVTDFYVYNSSYEINFTLCLYSMNKTTVKTISKKIT